VLAFLSVRLQCNIDALRLLHHELPARETDHILEFDDREFQVQFHACFPGYVALTESYLDVKDAGILPTHNGCIRFVARHPAKKILKSTCVSMPASIAQVTRSLFPDLCGSVTWTEYIDGMPVPPDDPAHAGSGFDIEWDCFKPLVPTRVDAALFAVPIDSAQSQIKYYSSSQRWIKSPLKMKPQVIRTNENVSIM